MNMFLLFNTMIVAFGVMEMEVLGVCGQCTMSRSCLLVLNQGGKVWVCFYDMENKGLSGSEASQQLRGRTRI